MSHVVTLWTLAPGKTKMPPLAGKPQRVLLALDGRALSKPLLAAALRQSIRLTDRIDILLLNPPKEPTTLLASLLLRLEHSGIDYRLASMEGSLEEEIERYLHRFQGVSVVLVGSSQPLEEAMGAKLQGLRRQGFRFIGLMP